MSKDFQTMYARYRNAAGMTQEYAAELLGVATRTLAAWERGESKPSDERVLSMVDIYCAPTLAIEHLRATTAIARGILPPVDAVPLPQAVCQLLSSIRTLEEIHAEDRLLQIAADGQVDQIEAPDFTRLLEELEPVMAAVLAVKYARGV
ncbi:MAG: helix-turn-helix domain-containing protein [Oscillospiraceae bacterium]|nr:helix-turn-helix domain-containing protein [Oscillospiraceae bacterium]